LCKSFNIQPGNLGNLFKGQAYVYKISGYFTLDPGFTSLFTFGLAPGLLIGV
jgi:hypothetical protein